MAKEKYSVLDKILDLMEQYPDSFIPKYEMKKILKINPNTCNNILRKAYLYGLVEKTGPRQYQKFRMKEKNREKWKIIYKEPTKEWRKKVLNE